MSNAEYGLDGNFTAEAILGLGGEIVFGSADEALSSVNATDAFRMSAKIGGLAVAVTVESVDIIDAVRSGDTTGAAVETGGLTGALAGAWLGGQVGSLGGWPGAILGAAVGAYLGEKCDYNCDPKWQSSCILRRPSYRSSCCDDCGG